MTRRIIMGDLDGRFRIRVAKPGYDAGSAPLDGLLFDADHLPIKPIFGVQTLSVGAVPVAIAQQPQSVVYTHNLGFIPLVAAIATHNGSRGDWTYYVTYLQGTTLLAVAENLGNGFMTGQYCTPFRIKTIKSDNRNRFCGWWHIPTSSNITFYNQTCDGLFVKFQMFDWR